MITYRVGDGLEQIVKIWKFPDTSIGTNICRPEGEAVHLGINNVTINVQFGDKDYSINDTLFALETVYDALRTHYPMCYIHLRMPYIPYSRQDRVCNPGEGHSLKRLARRINDFGFTTVSVLDPHSNDSLSLINNVYSSGQYSVFGGVKDFTDTYIVAPDEGAQKKCEEFARLTNALGVVVCKKRRDLKTGKIKSFEILDAKNVPPGSDFFVLDDICDKGGTFLAVAEQLDKLHANTIELAVTHGLFTHEEGVKPLTDEFDKVYTTNSVIRPREEQTNDAVVVIDIY